MQDRPEARRPQRGSPAAGQEKSSGVQETPGPSVGQPAVPFGSAVHAVSSTPRGIEAAPVAATREQVVARLYREHAPMAFKLALRYGRGDRQWAEDLVHDVYLEVHRHAERLAVMDNPGGWIYRATTSRSLNRLRRERWLGLPVVRWLLATPEPSADDPERARVVRGELGAIFDVVSRLPDAQRVCFWMRHVDGMSQPEIAEALGFGKSYVCKLLQRADDAVARARAEADRRAEHG
jgi:RNA polymerase sigma factor (sigma-70 family)